MPAEVLGGESVEMWALHISGGPIREVLTVGPSQVGNREYVFVVPLDVMRRLALKLTEVYEERSGTTL